MSSVDRAIFGDLLRRARRAAELSQEELAERAGLSARAISDLERGVNRVPRRDTLEMLADALSINAEQRRQWERMRRAAAADASTAAQRAARPSEQPAASPPMPLTELLGREQAVADVCRLLAANRLVTLIGPGGVGKTRLSLAIAQQAQADNPDGVQFISLAAIRDAGLVLTEIARLLGIDQRRAEPRVELVAGHLGRKRLLLVLDNVEQVVEAAPELAGLLERCAGLTILVTSRTPLRVRGEQLYPVAPLEVPCMRRLSDTAETARVPSVALFLQRMRQADPAFAVTEENVGTVVEICRRLDGLPLAIELAAARGRMLSPTALLVRLERPLALLTGGARDLPDRQRTMRATIEWSYDLLEPGEQWLLRRLSVFVGGWTLESAEAFAVGTGEPGIDIIDGLMALVDNCLVVRQEQPGQETRFTLLETIREFGLEQLNEVGEADVARQQHAGRLVRFALDSEPGLFWSPAETLLWFERYRVEHDNILAALSWLLETGQAESGLQLIGIAALVWIERGYHTEIRRWVDAFLRIGEDLPSEARMKALLAGGGTATWQGDLELAGQWLNECLRGARVAGDRLVEAAAMLFLGIHAVVLPNPDIHLARERFERSLSMSRELGFYRGITVALNNLGNLASDEEDYEQAISLFQEAYRVAREHKDVLWMEGPLGNLGWILLEWGDPEQALAYFREALGYEKTGHRAQFILMNSVRGTAHALLACGEAQQAMRLLGAVQVMRDAIGNPNWDWDRVKHDDVVASARTEMGEAAADAAWREGQAMTIREVIAAALAAHC
jgi:predicted ATPase/DNA-binding XRE family transcriptional regulator